MAVGIRGGPTFSTSLQPVLYGLGFRLEDKGKETYLPLKEVDGLLINVEDVHFVEFMKERIEDG